MKERCSHQHSFTLLQKLEVAFKNKSNKNWWTLQLSKSKIVSFTIGQDYTVISHSNCFKVTKDFMQMCAFGIWEEFETLESTLTLWNPFKEQYILLSIFLLRLIPYCQYSICTKFYVKWTKIFWDTACFFTGLTSPLTPLP